MFTRRISVPTVKVRGAVVTVSLHLASHAARTAQARAKAFVGAVEGMPPGDAVRGLQRLHDEASELDEILAGIRAVSDQVGAAAAALNGQTIEAQGPLVELAMMAQSQVETLKAFDDSLDLIEAERAAAKLAKLSDDLAEAATVHTKQAKGLRDLLRIAVEAALVQPESEVAQILRHYDPTDALSQAIAGLNPTDDAPAIRLHAKATIGARKQLATNKKRARQHAVAHELETRAAALWEDRA